MKKVAVTITVKQVVRAVLDGKIADQTEFDRCLNSVWDKLDDNAATAVHQAKHFISDADIRLQDPLYAKWQESELEKYLRLLDE